MAQSPTYIDRLQNGDSTFFLSYVVLRGSKYHVCNSEGKKVAVVNRPEESWPAVKKYYLENPRWFRDGSSQYFKITSSGGLLQVERKPSGKWVAYCNLDRLLNDDGKPAIFASLEDAQRAAEERLFDELVRLLMSGDDCSSSAATTQ
jgi:hypothetical protein